MEQLDEKQGIPAAGDSQQPGDFSEPSPGGLLAFIIIDRFNSHAQIYGSAVLNYGS